MRRICLIIRKLFLIKIIDTPYPQKQMRRMALTFRNFLSKTDTPYLLKQMRRITLSLRKKNFLLKTDTPYLGEKMRRIELIKRVVFYKKLNAIRRI